MTIEENLAGLADRFCKMNCPVHATEQRWPHDPDCETLQSAVRAIASARIKGDKDRATQSSAPNEIERLRTVMQWIADTAYVDHQSGNENFEHLQSIARDALAWGEAT